VQAVDLNLATRPFKNDTLLWVALLVAVTTLGWLTWWNVQTWRDHRMLVADLRQDQANIEERFDSLDQRDRRALRDIDRVDLAALSTKLEKANEVIRWKSFSWTQLFNLLERVQPYNVQMASVHPVFRGERSAARDEIEDLEQVPVSVEGTAKTLRDLLEFERNLIFDPHFDRVEPERFHTDENSGETIFRMRFLYDPRVGLEVDGGDGEAQPEEPQDGTTDEDTPGDEDAVPPAEAPADSVTVATAEDEPRADDADTAVPEPAQDSPLASDSLKKIRRDKRNRQQRPAEADALAGGVDSNAPEGPAGGRRGVKSRRGAAPGDIAADEGPEGGQ
jgi:hypothetical protein